MSPTEPLVLIVSGPSGSGKSTLVQKILEVPGTMLAVSSTTRAPRKTESNGKWYNFVSEVEFQQMVQRGEFLEYAQVFGKNWYGTPLKSLGEFHVPIKLHREVTAHVKVQVVAEAGSEAPAAEPSAEPAAEEVAAE